MRLLICGHGNYGECVFSTLKFFKDDIDDYVSYINDGVDFNSDLCAYLSLHKEEDIIILTDLLGGGPNAEVIKAVRGSDTRVIAGLNIGGMLEILFRDQISDDEIEELVDSSKSALVYVNDMFRRKDD